VGDRPTFIGSFLAGKTKTWACTRRAISLLVPLLLFLETPEYPPCLAFLERAARAAFYGEYPSPRDKVSGLLLSCVNEVEHVIFEPTVIFRLFGLVARAEVVLVILGSWSCVV